jgi:ADP-ribose pyrophosphatase
MAVYLATGLHAGEAEPEEDEVIQQRLLALPAVVKMILNGTIRDAKTIASVLWLDRNWTSRQTGVVKFVK